MTDEIVDPKNTIALSSRVRLARNYADVPFPHRMSAEQAHGIVERTQRALGEGFVLRLMEDLTKDERQVMVEAHLISPELAQKDEAAVLLNEEGDIAIMIAEEDHLRLQAVLPGLQLHSAMSLCNSADDKLQRHERFAFDTQWGYLTACPTNTGTGMRASVMLHLPALSMLGQTGQIIRAVAQIGLTVRGFYGEGSEASGNLYQLSNQVTLGRTEEEILKLLSDAAQQVMQQERMARSALMERNRLEIEDRLMRSYGVFVNACKMDTKEFMSRLSDARLATDLGFLDISPATLSALMQNVQPATLERNAERALSHQERDVLRAKTVKGILQ